MDDKLGFLAEQSTGEIEDERMGEGRVETGAQAERSTPPPAADPHEEGREERPRGPDGRFSPKAAATPAAPEPGHVPISAMLDEREKRQALERQLAEIRARQDPPPPLAPVEQLQSALYAQNLRASRRFAERDYGKETIAAIHDWALRRADEDPYFNQLALSSDDPYELALQVYNRERVLAAVKPGDLEAFRAWQASHGHATTHNPHHPSAATPLPRSLATAPGNGAAGQSHVPVGPRAAFDAVFSG